MPSDQNVWVFFGGGGKVHPATGAVTFVDLR